MGCITMKILIVDDEALARQQLRRLLEEANLECEIVGEAADGQEALALFDQTNADIVLLDIRMPGMDGLAVAKELSTRPISPAIIMVTAYDEHAIEAFQAQAQAYLLKPVRQEALEKAIASATKINAAQMHMLNATKTERFVSASYRGGVKRVALGDVFYFRAENKYVVAYHEHGELVVEETLKDIEQQFPQDLIRVHRNALVSIDRLQAIEKTREGVCQVRLIGTEDRLEVSRRHASALRAYLKK